MTLEEIQAAAQSGELQRVLEELGATPEAALLYEGRQNAMGRFGRAHERATELGQTTRVAAIDARIDRDAQAHARREMARLGLSRPATLTGAPVQTSPAPLPDLTTFTPMGPAPREVTMGALDAQLSPYNMPGYRPTGGIALGPQSVQEEQDLRATPGAVNALLEVSGIAPVFRAGQHLAAAGAAGDPIRGGASIGEGIVMALPFTRAGRAAFATLPRAMGTGLGAGVVVETAAGRGPLAIGGAEAQPKGGREAPSEAVMALQRQLQEAGYYSGPIDGLMGKGTRDAKAAFDAAQSRADSTAIDRLKAQADADRAAAGKKTADTAAAETARKAAERAAGEQRLRDLDSSWLSQGLNAAMSLGPWLGFGIGGYLGHRLQNALTQRAAGAATTRAAAADAVMAQPVPANDVPGRIGRVNRFWSEGNPAGIEPFRSAPRAAGQHPYTVNTDVPTAAQLYRTPTMNRLLEGVPVPVVGGLEHISAEYGMARPAREALAAAQAAVQADPSEANIQSLQLARARMAVSDLTSRIGWGMGVGSAGQSVLHSIGGDPRARPASIAAAERERGLLTSILQGRPTRGGGGGPRNPNAGGGGGGPVADPRLGGSGHRDPLTGRITRAP